MRPSVEDHVRNEVSRQAMALAIIAGGPGIVSCAVNVQLRRRREANGERFAEPVVSAAYRRHHVPLRVGISALETKDYWFLVGVASESARFAV
jgi:hypothetical protein